MSHTFTPKDTRPNTALPSPSEKHSAYTESIRLLTDLLGDEQDEIAIMATISAVLRFAFPHFLWVGFYRVDPQDANYLIIGPYQGELGCSRIAFGRGVCGSAAAQVATIVVCDVAEFEGHIACDSRAKSEIVIPVKDCNNRLIGVFDIDSDHKSAFDDIDANYLEYIVRASFARRVDRTLQ